MLLRRLPSKVAVSLAKLHLPLQVTQFKRIIIFVKKKLQALMKHELFSLYKTGVSEETQKKVQKKYLDAMNELDAFQWCADQGQTYPRTTDSFELPF